MLSDSYHNIDYKPIVLVLHPIVSLRHISRPPAHVVLIRIAFIHYVLLAMNQCTNPSTYDC
jgi:hypothetical protein